MSAQSKMERFKLLLNVSNVAIVVTVLGMLLSVLIAYPYANHFSLPAQIAAHVGIILIAALLKVSYVARCLAQYNLGLEVR